MKKNLLFTSVVLTAMISFYSATGQSVGIGTTTPDASAILDIKSTNKGVLVPQVSLTSSTDVTTVPTPATGLLVYNTSDAVASGTGFYYNSGTTVAPVWTKLQSSSSSGWGLGGNAGTDTAVNFLGTTDNKPLRLRVNNSWAGQLGISNVFFGNNAGSITQESTTGTADGSYNVGIGNDALALNILGHNNIAIGSAAMLFNFTDNNSVAIGDSAMVFNDDPTGLGNINTAVGSHSMALTGRNGIGEGYYNVAIGGYSLFRNNYGNGNTAIGTFADITDTAFNNSTVIGFGALVDDSNKVRIGNTDVTSIGGQVGWTTFSDGRYKKDVQQDVKGLDFIMQLRPLTYHLDMQKLNDEKRARYARLNTTYSLNKGATNINGKTAFGGLPLSKYNSAAKNDGIRYTGLIAQEVEAAAKNIGYDFSGVDKPSNGNGKYGIRYADFVVPLIKAVQEQQSVIDAQNKKIDLLEQRLTQLENK